MKVRVDHAGQTIPLLREYVLVDQGKRCVEVYRFSGPAIRR